MIYKAIHRRLKVEQHESRNKQGLTQVLQTGKQFLITSSTHHVTVKRHEHYLLW